MYFSRVQDPTSRQMDFAGRIREVNEVISVRSDSCAGSLSDLDRHIVRLLAGDANE
jgi:hypothetical protein